MNLFKPIAIANPSLYKHVLCSTVMKLRQLVEYRDIYRRYFELYSWLTLRSRVLFGKLIVAQLVKFYGSRRFITVFTRARHCTLSWIRRIQFTSLHPLSVRFFSILFHLVLGRSYDLFSLACWTLVKSCSSTPPLCAVFTSLLLLPAS